MKKVGLSSFYFFATGLLINIIGKVIGTISLTWSEIS
jgi:hypothetical protein